MFNLEMRLKEEASNIEIPKGFTTNDTINDKTFNAITYNKNDGKSINEGATTEALNVEINSEINRTNLGNITNNNTLQENIPLNDYTNNQVNLGSINNERQTETQNLNFQDVINQVNLSAINIGKGLETGNQDNN